MSDINSRIKRVIAESGLTKNGICSQVECVTATCFKGSQVMGPPVNEQSLIFVTSLASMKPGCEPERGLCAKRYPKKRLCQFFFGRMLKRMSRIETRSSSV